VDAYFFVLALLLVKLYNVLNRRMYLKSKEATVYLVCLLMELLNNKEMAPAPFSARTPDGFGS